MSTVEAKLATVSEENAKLKAKLTDLEIRSHRNNIRVVGLPENIEGAQSTDFFSQLLMEVLGKHILDSAPELERAHQQRLAHRGCWGADLPACFISFFFFIISHLKKNYVC